MTDSTEWKGCMEFTLSDFRQRAREPESQTPLLESTGLERTEAEKTEQKTHCAYSNNLAHSRQTTSSNCARHTASRLAFLLCPDPAPDPDPILDADPGADPAPLSFAAALAARRAAVCGPLPSSASARRPTSAQSDMLLAPDEEDADEVPGRRPCEGPRRV